MKNIYSGTQSCQMGVWPPPQGHNAKNLPYLPVTAVSNIFRDTAVKESEWFPPTSTHMHMINRVVYMGGD